MSVNLTFNGNSDDAIAAIAKLERRFADMENRINKSNKKPKEDVSGWSTGLDGIISKYTTIGAGIGAASLAMGAIFNANQKWLNQLGEVADKTDEAMLKLRIQTGASLGDVDKLLPKMEAALVETPVANMVQAIQLQTQLGSSGFSKADIQSGAAFEAMLKLKAGTNSFGEGQGDPKELVQSLSMFLKGSGTAEPTAADIIKAGSSATALFEDSDIQSSDLKQLAPKMATLKNFGLSNEEAMGSFAALVDVMGGNKADTGLAQFVSRTGTLGAFPERAKALEETGLKPEDLAMAPGGKGFMETVDKLRGGLAKLPAERQNEILTKIYGEEAGPAASLLTGSLNEKTKKYIEKASDTTTLDRNVQTFQESDYAFDQASDVKGQFSLYRQSHKKGNYNWDRYNKNKNTERNVGKEDKGVMGRLGVTMQGVAEDASMMIPYALGSTPGEAGEKRKPTEGPSTAQEAYSRPLVAAIKEANKPLEDELRKNTEATKELAKQNTSNPRAGRPVNRNGNVEK